MRYLLALSLFLGLLWGFAQEDFDESAQDALIIYEVQGDRLLNPQENPATGNSIAEQKINFFYAYPELVSLREQILVKLYE